MKAALIIDLPDGTNVDDIKVLYKLADISTFRELYYSTEEYWNGCSLKALPEKKNTIKLQDFGDSQIVWTDRTIYQNEGWNACIDEILGKENETDI